MKGYFPFKGYFIQCVESEYETPQTIWDHRIIKHKMEIDHRVQTGWCEYQGFYFGKPWIFLGFVKGS